MFQIHWTAAKFSVWLFIDKILAYHKQTFCNVPFHWLKDTNTTIVLCTWIDTGDRQWNVLYYYKSKMNWKNICLMLYCCMIFKERGQNVILVSFLYLCSLCNNIIIYVLTFILNRLSLNESTMYIWNIMWQIIQENRGYKAIE